MRGLITLAVDRGILGDRGGRLVWIIDCLIMVMGVCVAYE